MSRANAHTALDFRVAPRQPLHVSPEVYPWLPDEGDIATVLVTLGDGTQFGFGSLISLSPGIKKIADSVPTAEAASAQNIVFAAASDILQGRRHPGISKTPVRTGDTSSLFSASRNIARMTRLIFAIEGGEGADLQTILKAGISMPKSHNRLDALLGIKKTAGHYSR